MKTIKEITGDILQTLGEENNPIGILLEGYLHKVITDIVKDKMIDLQIHLNEEKYISDCDFAYEDMAAEVLSSNPID